MDFATRGKSKSMWNNTTINLVSSRKQGWTSWDGPCFAKVRNPEHGWGSIPHPPMLTGRNEVYICTVPHFSSHLSCIFFINNFLMNNEGRIKSFEDYSGQWPWQYMSRARSEGGPFVYIIIETLFYYIS